jgi:hypothetical protein
VDSDNSRVQVFVAGESRVGNSSTNAGLVTFTTSVGSLTSLTAIDESSLPSNGRPTGLTFPFGFFGWTVTGLTPGQSITMAITHPTPIAAGTEYWKVINGVWTNVTSLLGSDDGDSVLTLTITDGGLGDADGAANGQVADPGGVAVAGSTTPSEVPFESFRANADIDLRRWDNFDRFALKSLVTLGSNSDGIQPLVEDVNLRIGTLDLFIPKGSFRQNRWGLITFEGSIGRAYVQAVIVPLGAKRFELIAVGTRADLSGTRNPVKIDLRIGNDSGSTTIRADIR